MSNFKDAEYKMAGGTKSLCGMGVDMKGDIGKSDQKQKEKYRDNYDDIFRKEESAEWIVSGLDLSMFDVGDKLYVSQEVPGQLTRVKPIEYRED